MKKYIIDCDSEALKKGETTIGFVSCSEKTLIVLENLKNSLKIRVHVYVTPKNLKSLKNFKNSEFLKINGIKFLLD
ncbi:MAG: hypothetical protein QW745_08160 [Thermoplasmata archaeon]